MVRERFGEESGFTVIELLSVAAILMILAAVAIPLARWTDKRFKEVQLEESLGMMRGAIDQYKKYFDEGKIQQKDVDQMGYPLDLDELVEGVDLSDEKAITKSKVKFLYRIPVDPMTGEAEWGVRSYQDDFDSESWGGENVYDVYSLSEKRALDGSYYKDW